MSLDAFESQGSYGWYSAGNRRGDYDADVPKSHLKWARQRGTVPCEGCGHAEFMHGSWRGKHYGRWCNASGDLSGSTCPCMKFRTAAVGGGQR